MSVDYTDRCIRVNIWAICCPGCLSQKPGGCCRLCTPHPSQLGRVSAAQIVIKFNADTKTQLSNWLGFHLQLNYHSISNNHSALYLNKSKHFVTRYVSIAYCLWQNLYKAQWNVHKMFHWIYKYPHSSQFPCLNPTNIQKIFIAFLCKTYNQW